MTLFTRTTPSRVALAVAVALGIAGLGGAQLARAAQPTLGSDSRDRQSLRNRIEARYEVVPLSRGVGLRPRSPIRGVQIIELANGTIAIDGAEVTGGELRQRLGADADLVLQLSYVDPDDRRTMFGPRGVEPRVEPPAEPPAEAVAPPRERAPIARRRTGERVKIFGSIAVDRDERVDGQVVAVLGSVRVDGEVGDQVVAVLGSVNLGPEAVVRGDVTAVGGEVRRAPGAEIHGNINEIRLGNVHVNVADAPWWMMFDAFDPFTRTARLIGTLFRLFLLGFLGSIIVLAAREPVEQLAERIAREPLKAGAVGILAELLFIPALVLTSVILALTVIGIPLLILLWPLVIVAMLCLLLWGFTATAYRVGRWTAGRLGWSGEQPHLAVWIGVFVILGLLVVARAVGVAGGPLGAAAFMLATAGVLVEFVAWTVGFGAALIGMSERWRMRRARGTMTAPSQ
jgi:hypothetical protein